MQKGKSQNGGNKKAKHAKISQKRTFFTPWYAHVHVRNDISVACKLSSVKMELLEIMPTLEIYLKEEI